MAETDKAEQKKQVPGLKNASDQLRIQHPHLDNIKAEASNTSNGHCPVCLGVGVSSGGVIETQTPWEWI